MFGDPHFVPVIDDVIDALENSPRDYGVLARSSFQLIPVVQDFENAAEQGAFLDLYASRFVLQVIGDMFQRAILLKEE